MIKMLLRWFKYLLIAVLFVIVILFLAILVPKFAPLLGYGYFFTYPPNNVDAKFVRTCGELNGNELTYQNLKTLNGQCFISMSSTSTSVHPCDENDVTNYLRNLQPADLETNRHTRFVVHESGLDNTWACLLELNQDNKIKAVPFYAFD